MKSSSPFPLFAPVQISGGVWQNKLKQGRTSQNKVTREKYFSKQNFLGKKCLKISIYLDTTFVLAIASSANGFHLAAFSLFAGSANNAVNEA